MVKGNLLGMRLSATLAHSDPKEPKSWFFFFFSFCPFPPFLSLYRGSFGQPEADHACAHPWPPPEIPVHTQQGPQGDGSNRSLTVSTCASAR